MVKDTKTSLLAILSLGMVGTWAYIIYEKAHSQKPLVHTVYLKDTTGSANKISPDSIAKIPALVIQTPLKTDNTLINSVTQKDLAAKINEINTLRVEISSLVKKNELNENELQAARKKISDIQDLVNQLQNQNASLTQNNSKLSAALEEAGNEIKKWKAEVETLARNNTNTHISNGSAFLN